MTKVTEPTTTTYHTHWGEGWVSFDASGVCEMGLPGSRVPDAAPAERTPAVMDIVQRLEAYWSGGDLPEVSADLLDRAATTPFMRRVYEVVSAIPQGERMTYAAVAAEAGRPGAARSVGAAMARNPFAPVIPCHRVVGSDGGLRGYGGGLQMKRALLVMEAGYG